MFCVLPAHESETPSHLPVCSSIAHWLMEVTLSEHLLVNPLSPLSPKLKTSWVFFGAPHSSSLHTILASLLVQVFVQSFPHRSPCLISTLPEQLSVPLISLTLSGKQAVNNCFKWFVIRILINGICTSKYVT